MPFRLVLAIALVTCVSCTRPEPPATFGNAESTPQAAKAAIIDLIRQNPEMFIGNPDPKRLADAPLVHLDGDQWQFGRFDFDLKTMKYSAMIGEEGPEPYLYAGEFTQKDGRLVALPPNLTRFHRRPTTP